MYVSISFLYLYLSIFLDDDKDSLHSEGNTEKTTDASTQVTDQTESTEYQPKEQGKGSYEAAVAIGTNNIHIQEAEGPFDRLGECEKQKEHFDHCESTCKLLSCHFSTLKNCYLLLYTYTVVCLPFFDYLTLYMLLVLKVANLFCHIL